MVGEGRGGLAVFTCDVVEDGGALDHGALEVDTPPLVFYPAACPENTIVTHSLIYQSHPSAHLLS